MFFSITSNGLIGLATSLKNSLWLKTENMTQWRCIQNTSSLNWETVTFYSISITWHGLQPFYMHNKNLIKIINNILIAKSSI